MKFTITNLCTAAIICVAVLMANPVAQGDPNPSCKGGKLCIGDYKVLPDKAREPKHKNAVIVVRRSFFGKPRFRFIEPENEPFDCSDPVVVDGGKTLYCVKQKYDDPLSKTEVVAIGVIDSALCDGLRRDPKNKVITPAECSTNDCACFMVDHRSPTYVEGDLDFPPSAGTGSGGSP